MVQYKIKIKKKKKKKSLLPHTDPPSETASSWLFGDAIAAPRPHSSTKFACFDFRCYSKYS